MTWEEMLAAVRHHLGDGLIEHVDLVATEVPDVAEAGEAAVADAGPPAPARAPELVVRVAPTQWRQAAEVFRDHLGCTYFSFLSGMDWQPNPSLDGEQTYAAERKDIAPLPVVTDPIVRRAGGSSRFQVMARVANVDAHVAVTVFADLADDLTVPSWVPVFSGADWHERETWEMFGFEFVGHPGLRHIYLPEEFEGFPLRKDFALTSRQVRPWPGLVDMEEMPPVEAPGAPSAADGPSAAGAPDAGNEETT